MKPKTYLLIIAALCFSLWSLAEDVHAVCASTDPNHGNYGNCQEFRIYQTTGQNLSYNQTFFNVTYKAGGANNFSDFSWTWLNETSGLHQNMSHMLLDNRSFNGSYAEGFIRPPLLINGTSARVFLYTNFTGAIDKSNPDATMLFGDDYRAMNFSGKWNTTAPLNYTAYSSNSTMTMKALALSGDYLQSLIPSAASGQNHTWEMAFLLAGITDTAYLIRKNVTGGTFNNGEWFSSNVQTDGYFHYIYRTTAGSMSADINTTVRATSTDRWRWVHEKNGTNQVTFKIIKNETLAYSALKTDVFNTILYESYFAWSGDDVYVPYVYTRTWLPSEPTLTEYNPIQNGINATVLNGNGSVINAWNLTATNGTTTLTISGNASNREINYTELPQGNVNITVNATYFDSETQNFQVNSTMGVINATFTLYRLQEFHANTSGGVAINSFSIFFTNASGSFSQTTTNGTILTSLRKLGSILTNLTITSSGFGTTTDQITFNTSSTINKTYTLQTAGITIRAFDEQATTTQLQFNATIANSTQSFSYTNQSVLSLVWNTTATGSVTITIVDFVGDYNSRRYFTTVDSGTFFNLSAYLLKVGFGQLVRFTVQDQQGNKLSGVLCSAQSLINGVYTTVAQAQTDSTGICTLYVSPTDSYQFVFSLTGFDTVTQILTPSSTDYTITMGDPSEINFDTALSDVNYAMLPTLNRINQSNGTTINFSVFSIANNLAYFSLNLSINGTSIFFQNVTTSLPGGTIVGLIDTSGYPYGTLINAYGTFRKTNSSEFQVNRTYIVSDLSYEETTVAGALDHMALSSTGCGTICKLVIVVATLVVFGGGTVYLAGPKPGLFVGLVIIAAYTFKGYIAHAIGFTISAAIIGLLLV